VIFYFLCALVGLFCLVALGLGPAFFVILGIGLALWAFRLRFRRWWGLPVAAAGLGLLVSVAAGWGWHAVVATVLGGFVLLAAIRIATRSFDRRSWSSGER
jgi:hypothetical protein